MKRADVAAAERVTAFLVAAQRSVSALRRGSLPHSWTASPELFASSPEFAAAAAALQRIGGDLTAADLAHTGVAALLGSEEQFDAKTVGADLARYAARGDVERLELVGLNACDLPDGPVPVAGWELERLGRSGVEDLMPVPAAVRFMPRPDWDLTAAAATWWLRRSTGRKARCKGLILPFSGRALHEKADVALPLLVLALADDAPLRPLSCFVVECGVAVHRTGGEELVHDPVRCGPGEQDLQPQFHDHDYYAQFGGRRSQAEWPEWRRFCEVVGPMVERAYQKASTGHQGAERFETSGQKGVTKKFINRAGWLGTRKKPNSGTFASALRPSTRRGRTTGTAGSWDRCATRAALVHRRPRTTHSTSRTAATSLDSCCCTAWRFSTATRRSRWQISARGRSSRSRPATR